MSIPRDPMNGHRLDTYRQAALELHSEIRSALAWKASGCEPAVADHMLLKAAEKWRPLLEDDPDEASGLVPPPKGPLGA